ncbi:MAG: replication protein [Boseongicola sp. SB0677_bin_26]|nr:replication protein [Boseongicola sp. SB0665_bin_10]MYG27596.1 replication protein [Boseongicola sp. SB0677_bin_26]
MADRYKCFDELAANERPGIDYCIRAEDRGSAVVILAPHGGRIEPGTSKIAEAIAETDLSFYAFEGLRTRPHSDLHITSHQFDEPKAIELVGSSWAAVAIHGRCCDGSEAVWLGGRATDLRDAVRASLLNAGFEAEINDKLPGLSRANICNRARSGKGVQLELPLSLRDLLGTNAKFRQSFCKAVRHSILPSSGI